jgi:arylsulfatase A-like enzyme
MKHSILKVKTNFFMLFLFSLSLMIFSCKINIEKTKKDKVSLKQSRNKPNVIFIMADDLGYGDLSCYGATKISTPNIDRLASEGKIFTDAHSASAVCTPSRYALLTGQYPLRGNNGKGIWGPAPITSELLINPEQLTIADVFKNSNYTTAAIGKWHLGFGKGENKWKESLSPGPNDLGFDYYYGIPIVNSAPPYVYVENDHVVGEDPKDPLIYIGKGKKNQVTPITPIPAEASQRTPNMFKGAKKAHKLYNDYTVGTVLVEKAVDWITEKTTIKNQNPFFLYLATTHIHHPFTSGKKFQGKSDAELYGDFVQELDWMVGEVVSTLEKQGVAENTLVIFTSDNGAMLNLGGRNAVKAGHKINGDLLGFKFGVWEGGHRVPFIAKWPGKIGAGTISNQLICNVDMLATFTKILKQDLSSLKNSDSKNILPALLGNPEIPVRNELILAAYKSTHLSLRKGKWMYIPSKGSGGFRGSKTHHHAWGGAAAVNFVRGTNSEMKNGKLNKDAQSAQLYNLEEDKYQATNIYSQHPEVVEEMEAILKTYRPENQL